MTELDTLTAIKRAIDLLDGSVDSPYSARSVAELAKSLKTQLKKLEAGRSARSLLIRFALSDLFAPAGDLQEMSIANGWAEEFLILAKTIDHATRVQQR
jgi:hypothetical protein